MPMFSLVCNTKNIQAQLGTFYSTSLLLYKPEQVDLALEAISE